MNNDECFTVCTVVHSSNIRARIVIKAIATIRPLILDSITACVARSALTSLFYLRVA